MKAILISKRFGKVLYFGLNGANEHIIKVLRREGVDVTSATVQDPKQIQSLIADHTHVIVCAFFVPLAVWGPLVAANPRTLFVNVCHSNVGFLSADPHAISQITALFALQYARHNFRVAANCQRFVDRARAAHGEIEWLPNLYNCESFRARHWQPFHGRAIRVGCFGAPRRLKNQTTAAAAAIALAEQLRAQLEFVVNFGRDEDPGVAGPVTHMISGARVGRVVPLAWSDPWNFRRVAGLVDVHLQPSYTESFNLTVADLLAEGVPSAVSHAVSWVPESWKAHSDDPLAIAQTARRLLNDPHAIAEGQECLKAANEMGIARWLKLLRQRA